MVQFFDLFTNVYTLWCKYYQKKLRRLLLVSLKKFPNKNNVLDDVTQTNIGFFQKREYDILKISVA